MTEIAYMTYTDWARDTVAHGTSIREWLTGAPYVFLDPAFDKGRPARPANEHLLSSIVPDGNERVIAGISKLHEFTRPGDGIFDHAVVVLFPFEARDCELLRETICRGRVARIFVVVWLEAHLLTDMLDGLGALNLFTEERLANTDPLQLLAAQEMVEEQYNGLASGFGKDTVIQLLRAFRDEGYPLDGSWIRALFAAGGTYQSGETVAKFLTEINKGVNHRVRPRFLPEIVSLLRQRLTEPLQAG